MISKHSKLEQDLSSGEIDKNTFAEKSKEYSDLNEIIKEAKEYNQFEKNKIELENIINDTSSDSEMRNLAEVELAELKEIPTKRKIKIFLLPKDEADTKNAMIEIRAGTGGLEASLFAGDLFKMYEKVSHKKWQLEIISLQKVMLEDLKK